MKFLIEGSVEYDSIRSVLQVTNGVIIHLRRTENLLLMGLLEGISNKKEIIKYIWPSTIVTDSSYYKTIFDLRNQMSLAGLDNEIIKTIPRKGVVFCGAYFLRDTESTQAENSLFSSHPGKAKAYDKPDVNTTINSNIEASASHIGKIKKMVLTAFIAIVALFCGAIFMDVIVRVQLKKISINGNEIVLVNHDRSPSVFLSKKSDLIYFFQNKHEKIFFSCENTILGENKCANYISYY